MNYTVVLGTSHEKRKQRYCTEKDGQDPEDKKMSVQICTKCPTTHNHKDVLKIQSKGNKKETAISPQPLISLFYSRV